MEKIEAQWGNYQLEPASHKLNLSMGQDARLWQEEIAGSLAWARALARAGVINQEELHRIQEALARLDKPDPDGPWEDVHAWLEKEVSRQTSAGAKLHTARSRNEQVVLDELLWVKKASSEIKTRIKQFVSQGIRLAEVNLDVVIPGRTHAQPAQAVIAGHMVAAHLWPLIRDMRALDALLDVYAGACPLGSGALAGAFVSVDRGLLAQELGFNFPAENSIDATNSRDYVLAFLFSLSSVAVHLSRFAQEWISGVAHGWIILGSGVSTSSSLMPHKRNPDIAELIRANSRLVMSDLSAAMNIISGLETGYHKDFQLLKTLMFRCHDSVMLCLEAGTEILSQTSFRQVQMPVSLSSVSRIKQLVRQGQSFREAYFTVKSEAESPEDWPEPSQTVFDYDVFGGTHPDRVKQQLGLMKKTLEEVS